MFYSSKKKTASKWKKEVRVTFKDNDKKCSCPCNCLGPEHPSGDEDAPEPPRVPPTLPPPRPRSPSPSPASNRSNAKEIHTPPVHTTTRTSVRQDVLQGSESITQMWAKRIHEFDESEREKERAEFVARVCAGKGAILFPWRTSSSKLVVKYPNQSGQSHSFGGGEMDSEEDDSEEEDSNLTKQLPAPPPPPPLPPSSHAKFGPLPPFSGAARRWDCWSPVRRRRIHFAKKVNLLEHYINALK